MKKRKFPHLLGSKWTASQAVMGWRHFIVCNRQDRKGLVFAELQSVCHSDTRLWVNAHMLKNRDLWQPGWQALEETSLGDPALVSVE
ncbi:MAG: TIGR02450 family Trp-rich protein [Synechococcales cyanobacterium]